MRHPSAEISEDALIGKNTKIWAIVQIRENAKIGDNCIIGRGAYIDANVNIGSNVKIQNYAIIYDGVTIEDGVFIGPHVCFTNDKHPRAINPDGTLKSTEDWAITKTIVKKGASIGANSTILPGITVGRHAMVGAGSVVTRDVRDFSLVMGCPAKESTWVCSCGEKLEDGFCKNCRKKIR